MVICLLQYLSCCMIKSKMNVGYILSFPGHSTVLVNLVTRYFFFLETCGILK